MISTKSSMLKLFFKICASVLLCVLVFCACAPSESDTPILPPVDNSNSQGTVKTPLNGGTLRIPMNANPYSMHPLFVREMQMRNIFSMIFEPLIEFNDVMEPTACLAESWKYDEAGGFWTVVLRTNVHWHDSALGEVDALDAVYTINTILSNPTSIYYSDISAYIARVEGYDNTLIIYPKNTSFALIYALNIPIIPQGYYEGKPADTKDIPVGSGCFKADALSLSGGTSMQLTAFTKWWKKLPYISSISAKGYSSTEAIMADFALGNLDCVPSSAKTTEIYEILSGVNEQNYLSHNYVFLAFNCQRPIMQQADFRKAVAYAIDRTDIINNVYLTKATGAEQPLFNDTSLSSASITRYDNNLSFAQEKLRALGYVDVDGDGYLNSASGNLEISLAVIYTPANPIRLEAAEYIQSDLKKIGVKVNIYPYTQSELVNIINNKNYDMILSGYFLSDTPNLNFIFNTNGSGNLSGYSSGALNNALAGVDSAKDLNTLKASMLNVQTIIADDLPQIGLFFEMNTLLYKDSLTVSGIKRESSVYSNINSWYFTKL